MFTDHCILSPHLHALSCPSPRPCCCSWNALASSTPSLPGATSVSSRSALSQPLSLVRWEVFDHEDYLWNDSQGWFLPLSLWLIDSLREKKHMYSLTGCALVHDSMLMSVLIHIPKWNKEQEPLPEVVLELREPQSPSLQQLNPLRAYPKCHLQLRGPRGSTCREVLSFLRHSAPCLLFCSQHQV